MNKLYAKYLPWYRGKSVKRLLRKNIYCTIITAISEIYFGLTFTLGLTYLKAFQKLQMVEPLS